MRRVPFGREVFPEKGRGEQIEDSYFRRCRICKTPLNTQTTSWSKTGEGIHKNGQTGDDADSSVKGGCWFCGSLLWSKGEPKKLPDDRNKPSREWKLRNRRRR